MGKPDPRNSHGWRKLRAARLAVAAANGEPCCRCGRPVDFELPGNTRWGPTVDHLRPLAVGGELLPQLESLGISHNVCNSRAGAVLGNRMRGAGQPSGAPKDAPAGRVMTRRNPPAVAPVPRPRVAAVPVGDWGHLAGNVDLSQMPADAAPPRLFSPRHPLAVGTFADVLLPWIDDRMEGSGQLLRWWQRVVLERAWEHDADGRLVWRQVLISTPRQVGKTFLTREHALARCANPGLFGEPQVVLHSSRTLTNSTAVHSTAWTWAAEQELTLLRRFGSERIGWPDGSKWMVSSLEAVYGHTASVAVVDEAWDVLPKVVTSGVLPILASRNSSQLWLLSTANRDATDLFPRKRVDAARVGSNIMLAEWSADGAADPLDLESFRLASPHWDVNRAELIESVIGGEDAPSQFLNQWPAGDGLESRVGWPPGWIACKKVTGQPPARGYAAIEQDLERSRVGVAVAVLDGLTVRLWCAVVADLTEAADLLKLWRPREVLAGASIHDRFAQQSGTWALNRAGSIETRMATPGLLAVVRDGRLSHNHDPATDEQVQGAVVVPTESGPMLSARRSAGSIPAVKAAAWAVQAAMDAGTQKRPMIITSAG